MPQSVKHSVRAAFQSNPDILPVMPYRDALTVVTSRQQTFTFLMLFFAHINV